MTLVKDVPDTSVEANVCSLAGAAATSMYVSALDLERELHGVEEQLV